MLSPFDVIEVCQDSRNFLMRKFPLSEEARSLATRKKEHIRNVKTAAEGSSIANQAWSHNHIIDFNNASVIDKGNFRIRKFLESWHTSITPNADNNSCPLPGQYRILFDKNSPFLSLISLSFLSHYIFSEFSLHSSFLPVEDHSSSGANCPMRVENVIRSPSSYNGRSHTSS